MRRLLLLCFFLGWASQSFAIDQQRWSTHGIADIRGSAGNVERSWLDGGSGKFRSAEGSLPQVAFGVSYQPRLQASVHLEGALYSDPDTRIGVTQAFWQLKPVSKSRWRARYKVGSFHVPVSFEHHDALWTSPYSISPSLINTWVGEELRNNGFEGRWNWRPSSFSPHRVGLIAGLFGANDSAGLMLAWRGWVAHDRQALLGETIDQRPSPLFEPTGAFPEQAPEFEPFVEVDNRVGYYLGTDWQFGSRFKLRLLHYDNRGDPLALENGQYAWRTRFQNVAVRYDLGERWSLLAQGMVGNTVMGPGNAVDNDFSSAFLLVSRQVARQRLSFRVEYADVDDRDFLRVDDPNDEVVRRATLSYLWRSDRRLSVAVDASRIVSDRDARINFGEPQRFEENQLTTRLRYQF